MGPPRRASQNELGFLERQRRPGRDKESATRFIPLGSATKGSGEPVPVTRVRLEQRGRGGMQTGGYSRPASAKRSSRSALTDDEVDPPPGHRTGRPGRPESSVSATAGNGRKEWNGMDGMEWNGLE